MSRKDEQVDRLLAAVHRREGRAASADCLDAETLAAWMAGSLRGPALARAEAHAAACGSCQAMLAAMARTAGAEAAGSGASARPWHRRLLPWAVPLTAAATAAALYFAVRPPASSDDKAAPAVARSEPTAAQRIAEPVRPDDAGARDTAREREAGAADAVPPVPGSAARPAQEPPALPSEALARREAGERAADIRASKPVADAAPVPPLPAAPAAGAAAAASGRDVSRPVAPDVQPAPAPRPPPPASARAGFARQADASAALAETVTLSSPVAVAASNPAVRWRIVDGRRIERSTDGGVTWTAQYASNDAYLTSAASPSPVVCWVAGLAGVVFRTIDAGRTWARVEFPERVDLTSVLATSADAAVVTTADGRTLMTTDGGSTWIEPAGR